MTTFTQTFAWFISCAELAHIAYSSTPGDVISHLIGSSPESFHNHLHVIHGALSLTRFSFSTSTCSFLSFSVNFLHSDLYSELDNPIVMEILCYSANKESEDACDVSTSFTLPPATVSTALLMRSKWVRCNNHRSRGCPERQKPSRSSWSCL